jgi:integrase
VTKRREYGTGSTYQRKSDWRWVGTVEHGYSINGKRRRVVVTSKGCEGGCAERCHHRGEIRRKLRDKKAALDKGQATGSRITVKMWADTYLDMRVRDLSPKAYRAAESPIRRWVVPTIGSRRLDQLTPADIRAVGEAQRNRKVRGELKPLKTATVAATQRAMMTMFRAAIREGHHVPERILLVPAPSVPKSDRRGMSLTEGLACLEVASELPHATRWVATLLYGMRQGECLGLTWDAIDFDAGQLAIEWQLQPFPYIDTKDKRKGFRVPDDMEARHLVGSYHLKRPKSRQGYRVAPLVPFMRRALLAWRDIAPTNPHNLVWPALDGRPANNKHDLEEWHAIQGTAGVGHPAGRYYVVHECRNFAATMLGEMRVDPFVIRSLLGHSDVVTSEGYRNVPQGPLLDALEGFAERLQLG